MKTKIQKFRNAILSLKGGILAVLMLCALQTFAQDAFYVYSNDGDFDGFFFDQVERMGYSKTDLEGVEQDVYVIQEIQTTDSLYRIPLANIDSIGFQQPEIKLNPMLRHLDELNLTQYVTKVDGQTLTFEGLPSKSRPQVGQVLVGFTEDVFGEGGFGGKVTAVNKQGDQLVVTTEKLTDFGDIFDQFITVEQLGLDQEGNVRRRLAGLRGDFDGMGRRTPTAKWDGNFDLSILNWSGRLQWEWKPNDATSINIGADAGIEVKARVVYDIRPFWNKRFYTKFVFTEGVSFGASLGVQFSGQHEELFPTLAKVRLKFPPSLPLFQVTPTPDGFLRLGGSINAQIALPKFQYEMAQTFTIDSNQPRWISLKWGDRDDGGKGKVLNNADWFSSTDYGITFNGFTQMGVKQVMGLETNTWVEDILYCGLGMEVYAGPKLEGELNLSFSGKEDGDGGYGLVKDSKIEFSKFCLDREIKCKWKTALDGNHDTPSGMNEKTFWSDTRKLWNSVWYFLPDFQGTKADYDYKTRSVRAEVHPRRQVFWRSWVGIGMVNKEGVRVQEQFNESESYHVANTFSKYETTFRDLPAGVYKVTPLLRSMGHVYSVTTETAEVLVPPYITISKKEMDFDAESINSSQTTTYVANTQNVSLSTFYVQANGNTIPVDESNYYSIPDWIDAKLVVSETEQRSVEVTTTLPNKGLFPRLAVVVLTATEGDSIYRDTIRVKQAGTSNPEYVKVSLRYRILGSGTVHDDILQWSGDATEDTEEIEEEFPSAYSGSMEISTTDSNNKISFSRSGDIVSISGTGTSKSEWQQNASVKNTNDHNYEFSVTIDCSSYPGRVISGTYKYTGVSTESDLNREEGTVWSEQTSTSNTSIRFKDANGEGNMDYYSLRDRWEWTFSAEDSGIVDAEETYKSEVYQHWYDKIGHRFKTTTLKHKADENNFVDVSISTLNPDSVQ